MSDGDDEIPPRVVTGYRYIVQSAGPGWSDTTEFTLDLDEELIPQVTIKEGVSWERYEVGPGEWVELRFDCIWKRSKYPIEEPNPLYVERGAEDRESVFRTPEYGDAIRHEEGADER